jgi:leucyl aminopeptidase
MEHPMTLNFAPADSTALPLHAVREETCADWLSTQTTQLQTWANANGFSGKYGQTLILPDASGAPVLALAGLGSKTHQRRHRFRLAAAAATLPDGAYAIVSGLDDPTERANETLGWLLGQYRFDRYATQSAVRATLVAPDGIDAKRVQTLAAGEAFTRDLINTPAADMGPDDLETAARQLATAQGAEISVITGDALLDANLPMIHAVGRAAEIAPRLIDMRWGTTGPTLTLVGKGVCFDTGGLNLKTGASMGLMKKDMGGSATVLGLAQMIMQMGLKLQLRVLIPAVENAVAGNSFRPGDILTARNGLSVEINNTDAEGRLVLADALTLGAEGQPDLMISMATLTGAARVAVGPDLAPFYADDDFAAAIGAAATNAADPVWRMPFHDPYEAKIEPGIANLDNAPAGGFAGSITAALFLRRFADTTRYAHFDIYGWQPSAAAGQPKGGTQQGARAILAALPRILSL